MKRAPFIPLAVLLFAAACSDAATAPDPVQPVFKDGPTNGTHFQGASADVRRVFFGLGDELLVAVGPDEARLVSRP